MDNKLDGLDEFLFRKGYGPEVLTSEKLELKALKVIAENYTESFYLRLVSHSDSESSIILIFDSIEETLYYRNEFIEKSEEFKVEVYRDWVRWYTENNNYPWLVSGKTR